MNTTNKLLDKYLATCYAQQDKEIAARLRVRQSTVSNWRAERAHPDAESVEKMAKAIGEPVGPWLASIEAERARNPAAKQVWLRLAAALGTTLSLALITIPHAAQAAEHCLLCQIMRETNTDLWIIGDLPRAVYDQQYRAPAATTVDTGILGRRSHSGFRC